MFLLNSSKYVNELLMGGYFKRYDVKAKKKNLPKSYFPLTKCKSLFIII